MKHKLQQVALWLFLSAASTATFAGAWAFNIPVPIIVLVWAVGAGIGGSLAPSRGDMPTYIVSGGVASLFAYFAFWMTPFARLMSA